MKVPRGARFRSSTGFSEYSRIFARFIRVVDVFRYPSRSGAAQLFDSEIRHDLTESRSSRRDGEAFSNIAGLRRKHPERRSGHQKFKSASGPAKRPQGSRHVQRWTRGTATELRALAELVATWRMSDAHPTGWELNRRSGRVANRTVI